MDNTISVSQLNSYIKNILMREELLHNIVVFGEISGFKFSGPHAYFTLKDKDGAIACSCFNASKTYTPSKEGESVIVKGSVDYYAKTGRLSLIVSTIQPVGKGLLHIQLEELKKKLAGEGLFSPEHKKAIPMFCKNVCVVTSKTGAVIRDIVRTVRNKNKSLNIFVYDVRVQGDGAASTIINGLKIVDDMNFDCIILARGGGSFEDLFCFNDEGLARTIYNMQTPIISAVGHETDFSISDFVADSRAATPTAAGEMVAFDEGQYFAYVKSTISTMFTVLKGKTAQSEEKLRARVGALQDKTLKICANGEKKLGVVATKLENALSMKVVQMENQFAKASLRLEGVNPLKILKNGYFKAESKGKQIQSITDLNQGDDITVIGQDGKAVCKVEEILPFDKKGE